MNRPYEDLTGQRFGRLMVIKRVANKYNRIFFLCKCDCGNEKEICGKRLSIGQTRSCGCLAAESIRNRSLKHGYANKERLYRIWKGMRQRCNNVNNPKYKDYGGRGVKICDEWDNYLVFREWALQNGYTDELSIDRVNVDGDYEPSNCRWSTDNTQANNKRINHYVTINNETHTLAEWANISGISLSTLKYRVRNKWEAKNLLNTPKK